MNEQPDSTEEGAIEPADSSGERVGDALRAAVERTLAATADSAEGTRQRAQELLDDVVRRGQVARDEVARRGEEATSRLAGAVGDLRRPDGEATDELSLRLANVEQRLAALEAAMWSPTNPQVEPENKAQEALGQRDSGE